MKNYLIVGGSRGIGNAIATQLSEDHSVYSMSRSAPTNPAIQHIPCDVIKDSIDVDALPDNLDGVVYCPGSITLKPFRSISADQFRSDYEINVIGAVNILNAVERKLKSGGQGAVVLFSTVAVEQGMPFHTSISAAKSAVEGLTRSLAAEWTPKIRVNCIAPSLTDTDLAKGLLSTDEKKANAGKRHPLKRIGQPEDIAQTALFLLSEQASWITGQVIGVDGGMSRVRV